MSAWIEVLKGLEAPGGVLAGVFGKGWFDRAVTRGTIKRADSEATKIDADAAKVFTEIAVALVVPLEKRIAKLERENSAAFDYIRTLLSWIRTHVPSKTPPPPPEALDI